MWIVINKDSKNEISVVKEGLSRSDVETLNSTDENEYVLWDGEWPEDKKEMEELMASVFEFNKGKELRIFPNAKVNVEIQPARCGCPSRCFCQWENGRCSCWTSWCRPNGCNWVRCNGRC